MKWKPRRPLLIGGKYNNLIELEKEVEVFYCNEFPHFGKVPEHLVEKIKGDLLEGSHTCRATLQIKVKGPRGYNRMYIHGKFKYERTVEVVCSMLAIVSISGTFYPDRTNKK